MFIFTHSPYFFGLFVICDTEMHKNNISIYYNIFKKSNCLLVLGKVVEKPSLFSKEYVYITCYVAIVAMHRNKISSDKSFFENPKNPDKDFCLKFPTILKKS